MKNNIEDERRLLDRTVEKLQREVSALQSVVQQHDSHQIPTKYFAELFIYLESKSDNTFVCRDYKDGYFDDEVKHFQSLLSKMTNQSKPARQLFFMCFTFYVIFQIQSSVSFFFSSLCSSPNVTASIDERYCGCIPVIHPRAAGAD